MWFAVKIAVSAILVALISEVAKRNSSAGAILASIPIISVLAMIWIYVDTHDSARVAAMSKEIFWLVLPSLIFFIALPQLLSRGWSFYSSLFVSLAGMVLGYFAMLAMLRHLKP